jgi:NAD(P)-dependent dehydrogenase (short-subunit alcohol dehydrogenase family)
MHDLHKQTVLITGASDGFGKYVATKMAAHSATLLLHGRDPQKILDVATSLRAKFPGCTIETFTANYSNLQQVTGFAKQIIAMHSQLDLIINNAGIGFGRPGEKREISTDGYELRFAVNYLAPYLLTRRLLPLLKISGNARIVNIASLGQTPLDFNDIMLERKYDSTRAYCQSKLALVMATFDWAEELKADHITVNAIHPASYADTEMVREAGITPQSAVADGGEPIIALATDPRLAAITGQFFNQCSPVPANAQAYDATARHQLRYLTRKLLQGV